MKRWNFNIYSATLILGLFFPVFCGAEISLLARVDGEAITSADIQGVIRPGESIRGIVERLVEERLLFLEARAQKTTVSQEEIDQEYQRIMHLFSDPVTFYQNLKEESLTPATLRRRIERQMIVQRFLRAEVLSKVKISPKELENYLKEHRDQLMRQVSDFRLSEAVFANREEIPKEISAIEEKMKDLGFIPFSKISKQVQEALNGLTVGELSPVVVLDDSYAIFKITEIKIPDDFDEVSLTLRAKERLTREKYAIGYQELIDRLKKKAEIRYYLDETG